MCNMQMMLKLVEGDQQSVLGKIYTKTLDSSNIIIAILCLKMKGMAISLLILMYVENILLSQSR